jgi:H+-transporting ATPase
VKLSLGGVVAADVHLVEGSVLLDQSMLTGESLPIEAGPGVDSSSILFPMGCSMISEIARSAIQAKAGLRREAQASGSPLSALSLLVLIPSV